MAKDRRYVMGDHYVIDDRTGFKVRRSDADKEWTGAIVDKRFWEARQPQDLVKGVRDDQTVKDARPRPANVYADAIRTLASVTVSGNEQTSGFTGTLTGVGTVISSGADAIVKCPSGVTVYALGPASYADLGSVMTQDVIVNASFVALPSDDVITGLAAANTFENQNFEYVDYSVEMRTATAAPVFTGNWVPVQPISYTARYFTFRIVVRNADHATYAYLTGFNYSIGTS